MPSIIIFTACLWAQKEARGLSSSTITYLHGSKCHFASGRCGCEGENVTHSSQHVWHTCCCVVKFSQWCAWGTWIQPMQRRWCQSVRWFCTKMHWTFQLNMTHWVFFMLITIIWSQKSNFGEFESVCVFKWIYVRAYGSVFCIKVVFFSLWKLRSHTQLFSNIVTSY